MKTLRYFIMLLAVVFCSNIYAQKSQRELNQLMQQRNEYYFTFELNGNDDLNAIAHAISVDRVDGNVVTAYANNQDFANFQKLGYEVTLQTPPSLIETVAMWDGSNRAEYDWDSYPTYSAYEDMMFQFATDHPDKCEIITLGTLSSGRKILVAHLNNGTGEGKPKFLYTSTIHGDETTGWIMMLRLIDYLLENPNEPEVQTVMENLDLYIAPNTNPDGTYHGGNNTVNGARRENANGVDMNRNYADPHGGPHPDGHEYQSETQWFMQFADENAFVMAANYHGGAEVMNYPWDNTYTLHADDAWYQMISHEYADLTHQVNPNYMTDYNNGITNGAQWYMIGGGRQDYMNGYAQCRELTIECSNTKLPNGNQLPNFWNYNKNSLFAFMNQCIYGIHGVVTDSITGEPLEATITISGHDDEYSFVESHLPVGDFHRPIKGGNWSVIISKDGYCPKIVDVTINDYETVNLNVQLVPGSCMVADFYASETQVPLGQSVNFSDNSFGDIVSWSWEFEGGTPSTSTQQNPQNITYNEVGDYSVSLTITDGDGNSETLTRNDYIHVRESYNMENGTVTTCNAMFYDNGGPNGNYSNNRSYTMTFMPATSGRMLEVIFEEFALESNYDFLDIYDGTSTNASHIGQYTGTDSPGTITATNSEGALTFHFTSDYGVNEPGWKAAIHCVGDYEPIVLEVSADPMVVVLGDSSQLSVVATGGSGNYTYLWEPADPQNEGTISDPTIANPTVTPIVAPESTYKITVTDTEGNTASDEITIEVKPMSVSEVDHASFVYPNPNNGSFTIHADGESRYQLFNSIGQLVLSGNFTDKAQIKAEGLRQGVYFLQLTNEQGTRVEKLIIEK
jgi:PKD repeat protein